MQPKFKGLIVISLLVGFPPAYAASTFTNASTIESLYARDRCISDLKNRGYRNGQVPKGWAKAIIVNGQTVVLDDGTDWINIDKLFTKLTTICPWMDGCKQSDQVNLA